MSKSAYKYWHKIFIKNLSGKVSKCVMILDIIAQAYIHRPGLVIIVTLILEQSQFTFNYQHGELAAQECVTISQKYDTNSQCDKEQRSEP